jgi:hypothetical protein
MTCFSPLKTVSCLAGAVLFSVCLAAQNAPHANHEAHLGGAFATIAADTMHVEAIWSEQRRLRLFVSLASGGQVPIERLRDIDAQATAANRTSPLQLLEIDGYFEARIPTLTAPAEIVVRLRVAPGLAEEKLSFSFASYSPDVLGLAMAPPPEIPDTLAGILNALAVDRREAQALLETGQYFAVPNVEERIRERVLAIEPHLASLTAAERTRADTGIAAVVRACWLLHMALDFGDVAQRLAAFRQIGEGLDRLTPLVAGIPR